MLLPLIVLIAVLVAAPAAAQAQVPTRPNIIVVMTDDQALSQARHMPNLQRLIARRGTTFTNHFATFPLCCPSRATFLTGQYAHNHGVLHNAGRFGGYKRLDHTNTLPVWLQLAGYRTLMVGRYLNGYGTPEHSEPTAIPPGWSHWFVPAGNSSQLYLNQTMNLNGVLQFTSQYQSDLYADHAVSLIEAQTDPFFMYLSFTAPHTGQPREPDDPAQFGNASPAPRHRDAFAGATPPLPPSYDEANVRDKPQDVFELPRLTPEVHAAIQENWQQELESLLSVDEAIARVVDALRRTGRLDNTLIVFTSDNGYMHGEHRLAVGKIWPYDESTRIPLVMRGPGVPRGRRLGQMTGNVDVVPTLLEAAGAAPGRIPDGRSLFPLMEEPRLDWGREVLLESAFGANGVGGYAGLRNPRYLLVNWAHTGEREMYDLKRDPAALQNVAYKVRYERVQEELTRRMRRLSRCRGRGCFLRPRLSLACRDGRVVARGADSDRLQRMKRVGTLTAHPAQRRSALHPPQQALLSRVSAVVRLRPALLLALAAALLPAAPAHAQQERPNVLVLMTDDQTLESMSVMPRTRELIGDRGVTFTRSFANFALCCPSRATFYTGQYAHNHGVLSNQAPNGGYERLDRSNWLPLWLQAAGYRTMHVGKFLNGYEGPVGLEVPLGFSDWHGTIDPSTYRFYNYTVNENGTPVTYGANGEQDFYSTDFFARRANELIAAAAPSDQPFFMSLAFLAPHGGQPREDDDPATLATPAVAPRHKDLFATTPLAMPPSYNEADVSDKPLHVRRRRRIGTPAAERIRENYQQRLESLVAVDEAVASVLDMLRRSGELDNTLVMFTSDNGFFHGEHRIRSSKTWNYEPAIRLPLLMRGPGIPAGTRLRQLVTNADLAPTILEAAGATPGRAQDGRSLLDLVDDPTVEWGRELLITGGNNERKYFDGIRNYRFKYVEHATGEVELYDLRRDPDELKSLHGDPRLNAYRAGLRARLAALRTCAGSTCHAGPRLSFRVRRRCPRSLGRVSGADARSVERVRFQRRRAGSDRFRRLAGDARRPFRKRLRIRGRGRALLRARVALADGRAVTLDRRVRGCG